jgi:hypothetical protein
MPPKKKKGKGKKGKGKKGGDAAPKGVTKAVSLEAESLLHRQSLEQETATLKSRCESYRQQNEELKLKRAKGEKDTHEFVAYFQKELEKKDDQIAEYKDEIIQRKMEYQDTKKKLVDDYESRLSKLEDDSSSKIEYLEQKLKIANDELTMLGEFKQIKELVEKKLKVKEDELERTKNDNEIAMNALERKFLEEKNRINKEHEQRIADIQRLAREEAQKGLDADTRRIVTDNRRMGEELRFQLQTTEELQEDVSKLKEENKRLKREVIINAEKEQIYAAKSNHQVRDTRELQAKVKMLERSLSQVVRDFEKERELDSIKSKQKLEEVSMANNGLKQLLKLKNRELKNIRKLAQTILDQRSEVEQYFLEALEQVKTEIRQKREDEYKLAMAEYNAQMRRATTSKGDIKFPSIKAPQHMLAKAGSDIRSTSDPRAGMLSKPVGMNEKVDLRDLGWEDRERVLRLLFAKINNVQGQMLSGESDGANRGGADSRNFSVGDSEQMWGSNVVPQTATSVDEEGFGYNKTGLV